MKFIDMKNKLRVWWISDITVDKAFYVPVETEEEAKKVISILSAYDCYEYNQRVKTDYCNSGGVQMWNEDQQEWEDWEYVTDDEYFDDIDEYCEEKSPMAEKLKAFDEEIFKQIDFNDRH